MNRPPTGIRLPSLTSLRWFAVSAVFLRHGEPLLAGSAVAPLYAPVAAQGATGVSFFFILSGFVLAWTHRPDDEPRLFYRRRVESRPRLPRRGGARRPLHLRLRARVLSAT